MHTLGSTITMNGKKYQLRKEFADSFLGFNINNVSDTVVVPKQRMKLYVVR